MSELAELRVGDHVGFLSGYPFSSAYFNGEKGVRLIRIRDLLGGDDNAIYFSGPFDLRWLIKEGEVLIGMDGDFNIVRWKSDPALLNQRILKVEGRPNSKITHDYFYYWCGPRLLEIHARTAATTVKHLSVRDLERAVGKFPSVNEQRRIATILTTLDEVIEVTEKLVEKHQQIKAGLMHDLFTRGLWTRPELARGDHQGTAAEATAQEGQLRPTPEEAPNLYQDSPLGLIPNAWKAELLDVLAKRGSGHTPNRHTPNFWDGGIKWVSLADSANLDQLYISETEKEISLLGIENSSAVLHPAGIVVLSRDAGVGKSAITTCPMAVSQHFMCWLCGPELDNHYLYYWLQDQKRVFENISTGTTIPTIGLGFFRRYKIAVPTDMDEQLKIRASLLSSDETLFALQNDLAKLRQQKQGLMHDLLTGRVRVASPNITDAQ